VKMQSRFEAVRAWVERETPRAAAGKSALSKGDTVESAKRLASQLSKLVKEVS